jgi:hypothetical protein
LDSFKEAEVNSFRLSDPMSLTLVIRNLPKSTLKNTMTPMIKKATKIGIKVPINNFGKRPNPLLFFTAIRPLLLKCPAQRTGL